MIQDFSVAGARLVKSVAWMLRPYRLEGATKVRVGRHWDGGYVMIDRFSDVEAAYSLGINDDVSWDFDMAQRGIKVFQYDHTIDRLPGDHPMFIWSKTGIAGAPDLTRNLDTLERLVEKNAHNDSKNLILKCDIEDAEWDLLLNTPHAVMRQFSQIVMEIHDLHNVIDYGTADKMRKSFTNLWQSHRVVHVHANNYGGVGIVGGYTVPCVVELTFARLDMGNFILSDESFPTALDFPCNQDLADIYLGRFDFP